MLVFFNEDTDGVGRWVLARADPDELDGARTAGDYERLEQDVNVLAGAIAVVMAALTVLVARRLVRRVHFES
jgi:hypothetical protein